MKSLKIGSSLHQLLSSNDQVKNLSGGRIYPIVADRDVPHPFIVYKRESLVPKYIKHGLAEDTVNVEISIVSDNYSASLDLAQAVRDSLDYQYIEDAVVTLSNATEQYSEGSFLQQLTFTIKN